MESFHGKDQVVATRNSQLATRNSQLATRNSQLATPQLAFFADQISDKILKSYRQFNAKWSPNWTANDPRTGNNLQSGPQMIHDRFTINIEWNGLKFGQWI